MPSQRQKNPRADRVARNIQRMVTDLLRRRVKDPRVERVMVTDVQLNVDLRVARVLWHLLVPGSEAEIAAAQAGLDAATGLFRSLIGGQLQMRFTPEIRFEYDRGLDAVQHIERLLASLPPATTDPDDGESS